MQDNEKKPALRFKGFTDPWEQRKLGDLCVEFRSGEFISASDITETGEYPVFGGNGLRGFTDRFNHDGEYTLIGRQGALCGNVNFAVGKSYFTEHAIAVRADKKNQTRFLYYLFSTMDLGQYSGQSAQPGLAVGNLVELKSTLPDKQEQEKISGVLTALDTLITLHQRKYEKLVNIKKSMLDKMFPQNGASVPEIRFKGFTDSWEQRKLGEICDFITKGATPTTYGFSWQPDGVPFFRNDSIKDNVFVFGEFSYISEAANEVLKRSEVHGNDILIAITGDIGKVGIIPDTVEKANINQHIARVRIRKEALPYFVYQYLASDDTQKEYQKIKTGLSMPQLSLEQVRDIVVKIPEFNEQGKIADCLRRIDTLITLHQRKLEKLQNIKKSCLEKMFV